MITSESLEPVKLHDIHKLMCDELGDLLHAENMLLKALPKFSAGSSAPALKKLFETHLEETRTQVERLEQMFELLEIPAREKKCEGMMGLLVECQHLLTRAKASLATDQGLISAARKVKGFESLAYSSVAVWAGLCGLSEIREMALEAVAEENAMSRALETMLPKPTGDGKLRKPKVAVALEAVS